MSAAFPWDSVVTGAFTLAAGLGVAWFSSRRAGRSAAEDRRRAAYADVVRAARQVLENFQRVNGMSLPVRPEDFDAVNAHTRSLATALSQATAMVELEAPEMRALARKVNDIGQKFAVHWYCHRDGDELSVQRYPSATATGRTVPASVTDLDAVIETFADAALASLNGRSRLTGRVVGGES